MCSPFLSCFLLCNTGFVVQSVLLNQYPPIVVFLPRKKGDRRTKFVPPPITRKNVVRSDLPRPSSEDSNRRRRETKRDASNPKRSPGSHRQDPGGVRHRDDHRPGLEKCSNFVNNYFYGKMGVQLAIVGGTLPRTSLGDKSAFPHPNVSSNSLDSILLQKHKTLQVLKM